MEKKDPRDTVESQKPGEKMNELEYAEYQYNKKMQNYIEKPSYQNRKEFLEANDTFMWVRYAYRKAKELLFGRTYHNP